MTAVKTYLLLVAVAFAVTSCGGASGSLGGGEQSEDPVAIDLPIAYVKRTLPVDEDGNPVEESILDPVAFNAGGELFMRSRASAEAQEINITSGVFADGELYDVKDVSVSYDGTRLLFAMRAPEDEDADEDEQPTWNIWEYDRIADELRPIIVDTNRAEDGQDVAPQYLADGRILFSSTRQRRSKAVLLDENKPQYEAQEEQGRDTDSFVLHTMNDDGTDIQQISFNQSHDLYPSVMDDGRVMFLRWDNINNNNSLSLYTLNPDGSGLSFLYGLHSQDTGTNDTEAAFWSPKLMPDGRVLALHKPRETEQLGGDILAIDVANFSEIDQSVPNSVSTETVGQVSISLLEVSTDGSPSLHGSFSSAWPLFDGTERVFVSWSQCRLQDVALTETLLCTDLNLARDDVELAEPLYGLWMYDADVDVDLDSGSQQPIVPPEEGLMYTDAVVMEARTPPTFIADLVPDPQLEQETVAILNIRSVYDFDGVDTSGLGIEVIRDPGQTPADQRPARFLRIEKAVSMPDEDTRDFDASAFGAGGAGQLMREIVGYVPIEPDGSVITKVPADIAISFSVLDGDGHRITQRHENWIHLEVGDTIECNGCHTAGSELPHGRMDAQLPSANPGAPVVMQAFANTEPTLIAENIGETMAEVWARVNGYRTPTVDIVFDDEWADPALVTPVESFVWSYRDPDAPDGFPTTPPTTAGCISQWNALCRILINYTEHIQPVWDLDRPDPVDADLNYRCTLCHSELDDMGVDQVPAGQIDLVADQSQVQADYATSYAELFFQHDQQELDEVGMLQFVLVPSGEFVIDPDTGEPLLDDDGLPVPTPPVRVPLNPILSPAGANASDQFFDIFEEGASHEDYLTPAELKLISEWLDIGAQYYNNPFAAPMN